MQLDPTAFLNAPGEMSALIREHDWHRSSLGPPALWPSNLRVTVSILLNSYLPMALWWGEDNIQIYNDAYALILGLARHPLALGRQARETWPEVWSFIGPEIEHVLSGNGGVIKENQRVQLLSGGRLEPSYWNYCLCPVDGIINIDGVLCIITDVTDEHHDLELSAAMSAGLLQIYKESSDFVAVLSGPQHVYQFVNDQYKMLMGERDYIGRAVRDVVPEVEGQGFFELLDRVLQSGQPFLSPDILMRYRPKAGGELVEVSLRLTYQPIRDARGQVFGIFVEGHALGGDGLDAISTVVQNITDAKLSSREKEIIRFTAAGKTSHEIGLILNIARRTVEHHITSASRKLDTSNRVQTVVEAIKQNLIQV